MLNKLFVSSLILAAGSALAAPASNADVSPLNMKASVSSVTMKTLKGDVTFQEVPAGLHVKGKITGLKANTEHGFHIHEKGECKGPDYASAGGHFNPSHLAHGKPNAAVSHAGDLGNLQADARGNAVIDRVIPNAEHGEVMKMQGKALIVHAKADDLKTQPAGDSGDRIGCGIIRNQ